MAFIDWGIVVVYSIGMLWLGYYFSKRSSKSMESYFTADRSLSWWVLAFSAVATYSCAGAAPAFTMLVYNSGLLGNWWWWLPWVIWMPIVAVFWSKFWRRLNVVTTAELIEVRYSGKTASVFRGIYGVFMSFGWAIVLMGYVTGWLGKAVCPIIGCTELQLIIFSGIIVLIYTTVGGLLGVAYTDVVQFGIFMVGNIVLIPIILHSAGGFNAVYDKVLALRGPGFFQAMPPGGDLVGMTLVALVIQGLFFAASPSGGEGFTAQRFMAAKNEFHAQLGQIFNAVLSLVVRVVPFLFLGIIGAALYAPGTVDPALIWGLLVSKYSFVGLTGLIVVAELSAYMSTISTEMNWGASYMINDMYRRFIKKDATERHYVMASKICTVIMLILSLLVAHYLVKGMMAWFLFINSVMVAFILPLAWMRFFWWRLNIYGEASAIIAGIPLGYLIWFPWGFSEKPFWQGFLLLFVAGWLVILIVTLLTKPEKKETLINFYKRCQPPGLWGPITKEFSLEERTRIKKETSNDLIDCFLGILLCGGATVIMTSLFGKHWVLLGVSTLVSAVAIILFINRWRKKGVFKGL
ncbi:MAG: sodium:solute symporter [bacterium]